MLKGAALVIPNGLILRTDCVRPLSRCHPASCEDPAARVVVELAAMEAVMAHERSLGHTPMDVSAQKKGWDIESRDGAGGSLRLIEVKGRHADARDLIITKNEILASLNAPDAFHLALVAVSNGFAHQPVYVQRFFKRELGFAETAVVFNLNDLLSLRAKAPDASPRHPRPAPYITRR